MRNRIGLKKLSEICEISSALVDPRRDGFNDLYHVGGANIESSTGRLFDLQTAKDEGLISGKFLFDERMVLYSKIRPYLKKVARPNFKGLCSADIYPLLPKDGQVDRGFLYYMLLTDEFTAFAIGGSARAGMPKVNRDHLFSYTQALPPLPEQCRIVAILDEAFGSIGVARANAEKNLWNARELFEKQLEAVFTAVDQGWPRRKLGDLITIQNGFAFRSNEYTTDGHFLIRIGNVTDGEINLSNPKYVRLSGEQLERFSLGVGDILVSLTGNVGRVGMVVSEHLPAALNQRVARVTVQGTNCDRDFVFWLLRSRWFRDSLADAAHGAAQQNVSTKEIENLYAGVPDLDVQQRTVTKFQRFVIEVQRLESIYQRKLAALDELKRSLLHEAFSGKL